MLKNQFKAFVLASKIYNCLDKMGLDEGIENVDFDSCNIYVRCCYLTIDNCKGELYKIPFGKINGMIVDKDDIYKNNRGFPDWVVYTLSHLYDFLKS